MYLFLFVLLQPLSVLVSSSYYGGRFFDPMNLTYAECVPKKKLYTYFGEKSEALGGRKCVRWSTVREELEQQIQGYYQYYFPVEYEEHSQCRTILLDQYERDPEVNNASAHSFVNLDNWDRGPWCYVKNLPNETDVKLWFGQFNSSYRPWPCFDRCAEQVDTTKTTQKPTATSPVSTGGYYGGYHYNYDLIENLTDRFFLFENESYQHIQ